MTQLQNDYVNMVMSIIAEKICMYYYFIFLFVFAEEQKYPAQIKTALLFG